MKELCSSTSAVNAVGRNLIAAVREPCNSIPEARHQLAQVTALFCQLLSLIDHHHHHHHRGSIDPQRRSVVSVVAQMVAELQLLAESAASGELAEDAQYCTHLLVDCAYHLAGPCKLALLEEDGEDPASSSLRMDELKDALPVDQ